MPSCAPSPNTVRVGSKQSPENFLIAEIYAAALRRAGIPVARRTNFQNTDGALAGLQTGQIDLYPEHILSRMSNGAKSTPLGISGKAKSFYERRRGITWLAASPADDTPCLATSQLAAERYNLLTVSECAQLAPQLRFAAAPAFLAGGSLERLQRLYAGFRFKSIVTFDAGGQYDALLRGDADVASAFNTDPEIDEDTLVALKDDKGFWARRNVAPIVRVSTLHARPRVAEILNRVSRSLTDYALRQMNVRLSLLGMDPSDVAQWFVKAHKV